MDFQPLLAGITTLRDLPALVRALGHRPVWQPLPPDALPIPVTDAALVGLTEGFEWLGVLAQSPETVAIRLSAALAARGRMVGVLALDPARLRLTLAVTLDHTGSASWSLAEPAPRDLERLGRLAFSAGESGVRFALRALEALDEEDLGRRFFQAFARATEHMADALPGPLRPADRRSLALVQLTRVLFLYFVQSKGWLDGRPDFLRHAVDQALSRRRGLHRHLLRPLFFGTLNRRPEARGRARALGRIPFLNGGLFEPHPLERGWRRDVPDAAWRDAFDTVFERFRFTAHETGVPGRIAPDMLGRVFEGLMAPDARRATGAFYTPSALVTRLVEAGLTACVAERLGCSPAAAREALTRPGPALHTLLADLTVLDPAVGSGAFLLGALDRLTELQAGAAPAAALRRRILARNLFGVDENPMAVRLAELRLWLAVIAEDSTTDPERVEPLPNLDGMVRQGDSLLDPAWSLAPLATQPAAELRQLRQAFVLATGPDKRELLRRLRQSECRTLEAGLRAGAERAEAELAQLLQAARAPTLFGERRGLDRALRQRLRAVRARLGDIRRLHRRLRREGAVPWFRYECQFADVMARGGFDLVVGNPPWVRAEKLPPALRARLAARYRCWRVSGRGFAHSPDLAVAFVERSVELLAPGGAFALLVPAKLATAGYARRLRAALADHCALHAVADLRHEPDAAFEATIYPAALVAARRRPGPDQRVALQLMGPGAELPQARLAGGGPWIVSAPGLLEALEVLAARHPRLGSILTPQLGVKTGANLIFLDPEADLEPALLRTALRGRDLRPFCARPAVMLFFPHDARGEVFPRLPPRAAAYVRTHEPVLRARVDYRGGPPWELFRVRPSLAPHRVVWADLARRLSAVALAGAGAEQVIPLNTCYLVAAPHRTAAHGLAAWLNSTWLRALARGLADPASGGFARFNARVVGQLPLPPSVLADPDLARLGELGAAGHSIQERLDALVLEHLDLPARLQAALLDAARAHSQDRGRVAGRGP